MMLGKFGKRFTAWEAQGAIKCSKTATKRQARQRPTKTSGAAKDVSGFVCLWIKHACNFGYIEIFLVSLERSS
jgi:hypothetical protein